MRPKSVAGLAVGLVLSGLLLAACAAGRVPVAGPGGEPEAVAAVANATVLAIRPIAWPESGGVTAARLRLLSDIGLHGGSESGPLVEVVVREDSGRIAAFVQRTGSGLQPGARVVVAGGRAVRLPPPAS